jgi:hypothetical protein
MHPTRVARALALAATLIATAAQAQERRPLVPLDLYHLRIAGQAAGLRGPRGLLTETRRLRRAVWPGFFRLFRCPLPLPSAGMAVA